MINMVMIIILLTMRRLRRRWDTTLKQQKNGEHNTMVCTTDKLMKPMVRSKTMKSLMGYMCIAGKDR